MTYSEQEKEIIQANNDALVSAVNEQIMLDTFDSSDTEVLRKLVEGLGDPRGVVRLRFAETLGEIGQVATPFLLEALAHHENVVVRRAAAKTLTIIADPAAIPVLVDAFLGDPDTVVKGSAAGALARIGEAAVPSLLQILSSSEYAEDIKGHAAWALAFMGSEAAEHLYRALDSDSLDVRRAVIGAIAHVAREKGEERACQVLITSLTDPDPTIRTEAAASLGQITYPAAIPHLVLALQDQEGEVRKAAVSSLGKVGDRSVLEPLQAALEDELPVVRTLAKLAISQVTTILESGEI